MVLIYINITWYF